MYDRMITEEVIANFEIQLREDEKCRATIDKYLRDVKKFLAFIKNKCVCKKTVLDYKASLEKYYAISSANSMLAALNTFFRFAGWMDCCVKQFKVQRKTFCSPEKELTKAEYIRLVNTAKQRGKERLNLVLQTICATGVRVSELKFFTVEAVQRGEVIVSSKNKTRTVFIVRELQRKLLKYIKEKAITEGFVFATRSGKQMSRCNIWREMKALCQQANVHAGKVFPHNLRHLFACTFYKIEKDIAKLADILGHSSVNTTRIYIVTTGVEHRRKMESMQLVV